MRNDRLNARPAVNPVFVPLRISENEIELRVGPFAGAKHTIKDSDGDGSIGELLDYIDGRHTVSEILDAFDADQREEIHTLIVTLLEKEALVDVRDRDPDRLWSYSTLASRVSDDEIERLRTTTVGVVTRGRIGTMVASDLAETGVDEVHVLDIEGSQRSAIESREAITQYTGDIESLVSTVDYVVYADNSPGMETAKTVNEHAVETGTPLTLGQVMGVEGIVGPTITPDKSPCLQCLLDRWRMNQSTVDSYEAFIESSTTSQQVHLPAHSRLVSGLLSKEATAQLLTGHGYVVGRTLDVDLVSMDFETNEILKMPRCDVCGASGDDWQRLVDPEVFRYD